MTVPLPDAAYLIEARAIGDFTADQLAWVLYLAKSAHQKDTSRSIDGCVEDAIERITTKEYIPDGFAGCGP